MLSKIDNSTNKFPEESRKLAHAIRIREVSMVVDAPISRKPKDTVKEITDAEIKDEEKHWFFDHRKLLAKLLLYSHREAVEIDEGRYGDKVANCSNYYKSTNDKKHERSGTLD